MDKRISIDGVCISDLGFSEELQQAPAFVEALSLITELLRKESYLLRKKIENLEARIERQETVFEDDEDVDFTKCDYCGIYALYDQEIVRTCERWIHGSRVCNWCFEAQKCPVSWISQNEEEDGFCGALIARLLS